MTVDAIERSWKVTELKENIGYYFAVAAENKAGIGKDKELIEAIIPQKEPSK